MNAVDVVYWTVGKGILATATRVLVRIRSYGIERLPREGGGTVVTVGCTDWAYGLGDPDVDRVTRNLITRLG